MLEAMFCEEGRDGSGGKSSLAVGLIPPRAFRSVLEQDTQPSIAPDELVGTLHGSHQSPCVCVRMDE